MRLLGRTSWNEEASAVVADVVGISLCPASTSWLIVMRAAASLLRASGASVQITQTSSPVNRDRKSSE